MHSKIEIIEMHGEICWKG